VPLHTDPPPAYVAIGDSYTSGEGLKPYLSGSDTIGNTCHRSRTQAYPEQMAGRDSGLPLEFHACSGADTTSYWQANRDQSGPIELPQRTWLNAGTALVSMTFGVDDLSWTNTIQDCIKVQAGPLHTTVHEDTAKCNADLASVEQQITTVKDPLVKLYNDALRRSPNAQIRVLGYPLAFPDRGKKASGCVLAGLTDGFQLVFAHDVEKSARNLEQALDNQIQNAVATVQAESPSNSRLVYIDTSKTFGDHTINCGDSGRPKPWINALKLTDDGTKRLVADIKAKRWKKLEGDLIEFIIPSFHPNSTGQQELADALTATLPK
jgi:GDSL-like lipase/acylhydrolase family protein